MIKRAVRRFSVRQARKLNDVLQDAIELAKAEADGEALDELEYIRDLVTGSSNDEILWRSFDRASEIYTQLLGAFLQ